MNALKDAVVNGIGVASKYSEDAGATELLERLSGLGLLSDAAGVGFHVDGCDGVGCDCKGSVANSVRLAFNARPTPPTCSE